MQTGQPKATEESETQPHAAYRTLISDVSAHTLNVKEWKMIFHENGNQKRSGIALLKSDSKLSDKGCI